MPEFPYRKIPPYPESYSAGTALGRLVDSLGFRYYWATEGLSEKELSYRPGEAARSLLETLDHIHYLATLIEDALNDRVSDLPERASGMPFDALRAKTLKAIERSSEQLKATRQEAFEQMSSKYQRKEKELAFPFWNVINGPMADALYHVGQVVSFRRAAGNPIDPKVHVFLGERLEG